MSVFTAFLAIRRGVWYNKPKIGVFDIIIIVMT